MPCKNCKLKPVINLPNSKTKLCKKPLKVTKQVTEVGIWVHNNTLCLVKLKQMRPINSLITETPADCKELRRPVRLL